MELAVQGRRQVGRPKKTWSKVVEEDMRKLNITEDMAGDRQQWKKKGSQPIRMQEHADRSGNCSACRLWRAIALACHRSRKIILRRAIFGSPARSPRQTIKSTCSICNSSFQNCKISHLKQLRQERQTTSMIVFAISV